MKEKLFITSLVILLLASCTAEDLEGNYLENKNKQNTSLDKDSSKSIQILDVENADGDPVNPKPPRK